MRFRCFVSHPISLPVSLFLYFFLFLAPLKPLHSISYYRLITPSHLRKTRGVYVLIVCIKDSAKCQRALNGRGQTVGGTVSRIKPLSLVYLISLRGSELFRQKKKKRLRLVQDEERKSILIMKKKNR